MQTRSANPMEELRIEIEADNWDTVAAVLETSGALSITQSAGDSDRFAEPGASPGMPWRRFCVTALFDDAAAAHAAASLLVASAVPGKSTITPVAENDWHAAWQAHWQPQMFAGGLCVCPSWCTPPAAAAATIVLDPGQAFGTGTHASTALCLDWLGDNPPHGLEVIDYGCGSAILALAAVAHGARRVWATDIDATALAIARDNVARNGCEANVAVAATPPADFAADLLLANILFEPLLDLRQSFARLLGARDGGRIVLAGILNSQAPALIQDYKAFNLEVSAEREGWCLVTGGLR